MVGSLTCQHSLLYDCNNATHTPPVDMPRVLRFSSIHSLSPPRFFSPSPSPLMRFLSPSHSPPFPFLSFCGWIYHRLLSSPAHSPLYFFFNLPPPLSPFSPATPLSPSLSVYFSKALLGPSALHYLVVQWPLLSTRRYSGISVISISVTCLSIF